MAADSTELTLEISPRARFEVIDARRRVQEMHGGILEPYPQVLYCSLHTTAGYLDQSLASRLSAKRDGVTPYLRAFQSVFPEGAGYRHDELHLRRELSDEQRRVEPRNGDSHLAFISAGLRTCVTYRQRPNEPVYFIDLDGVNDGCPRQRITSVVGFTEERVAARDRVSIPIAASAVQSINLNDPGLGLFDRLQALVERCGVVRGRLTMALADAERQAALTINEYETLLMQHDVPAVIRNPFRFMAERPCRFLARLQRTRTRRMSSTRFLRMQRSISLLVSECRTTGRGRLVQGRFQSPILVQWGHAEGRMRHIDISLTQFC